MKTHEEMVQDWMQDPAFVQEYNSLEEEFRLYDELLRARKEAGLTRDEIAERMATQPSVVTRLESLSGKRSPSLSLLRNYAHALGCRLEIKLISEIPKEENYKKSQPRQTKKQIS